MLRRRVREILFQVLLGDEGTDAMTRAERYRWHSRALLGRFHASEEGKISFVSILTTLLFVVIIVLVVNSGAAVRHKIELQNAADATAYSSALWQARSLNAITTANHLMGELTAVTVILDSFGGKMLGEGIEYDSDESSTWNDRVSNLDGSYAKYAVGGRIMQIADQPLVTFVVKTLTRDEGKHKAGAALYDAKLTLKFCAFVALFIKDKANYILLAAERLENTAILAWAGALLELVALPIHAIMSKYLVDIGIEWAYLEATELAVSIVNRGGFLRRIPTNVVPAISLYADTVVGSAAASKLGQGGAPFNVSVRETQQRLLTAHHLTGAETYPTWDDMKLPVIEEPPPISRKLEDTSGRADLGEWEYPRSEWREDFTSKELRILKDKYRILRNEMNKVLGKLEGFMGPIADAADAVSEGLDALGAGGAVASISPQMKEALEVFEEVKKLLDTFKDPLPSGPPQNPDCYPSNPCISDQIKEDLRLPKFYWMTERKSQWVRATYPYVDEYRAPIISFFRKKCPLSDAATYYANWSNRYTLANAFETRKVKDEDDSSSSEEQGLMEQLRKKVRKLRKDFEEATDDTDEENRGTVTFGKFDLVSKELMSVLEFRDRLPRLSEWFNDVENHPKVVRLARDNVQIPTGTEVPEETLRGLAEEMALVNVLDELLSLLEELLDLLEIKEPHMYVLQGMLPEGKGVDEPWLTSDELAEELFCVSAYVSRAPPSLMGPMVFRHGNVEQRYAVASALVYNANGRDMAAKPGASQPNTGWDTLNWEPPVRAPEWGDRRPTERSDIQWWQLGSPRNLSPTNRVKINWQVKLVPLTERRIRAIRELESSTAPEIEHHELITH